MSAYLFRDHDGDLFLIEDGEVIVDFDGEPNPPGLGNHPAVRPSNDDSYVRTDLNPLQVASLFMYARHNFDRSSQAAEEDTNRERWNRYASRFVRTS